MPTMSEPETWPTTPAALRAWLRQHGFKFDEWLDEWRRLEVCGESLRLTKDFVTMSTPELTARVLARAIKHQDHFPNITITTENGRRVATYGKGAPDAVRMVLP